MSQDAARGQAQDASLAPGRLRDDRLLRGPHRARPRTHPREVDASSTSSRSRASATSSSPASRTSRPTTSTRALNPLLVQVMALGYHFNMYRNKPLLKKGGVLILTTPATTSSITIQHPSYIEFFNRLLPETRDAHVLREKYEREFANNPSYVEMYRRGNAYHGAHPFFMWYWGENGRAARRPRHRRRRRERARPGRDGLGARRQSDRGHRDGAQLHGPLRPDHDAPPARDRHLRRDLIVRE